MVPGVCHDHPVQQPLVFDAGLVLPRVRRPYDLLAALLWLLITTAIVLVGYLATATAAGLESDLASAGAKLPAAIHFLLNLAAGLGIIALPLAAAVDAVLRRRFRALLDGGASVFAALTLTSAASLAITHLGSERLVLALAGSTSTVRGTPTSPVLAGLVALLVVGRISSRTGWRAVGWLVAGATAAITILTGGISATGVLASASFGAALGYLYRWLVGSETARASSQQVIDALKTHGLHVSELWATTRTLRGRHYVASLDDGRTLDVRVLDRDLAGGDLWHTIRRSFRVRGVGGMGLSVQRTLERAALMSYAVSRAGVPINETCLVCQVGAESSLIASVRREGSTLTTRRDTGLTLDGSHLRALFATLHTLHAHDIALRTLTGSTFAVASDGAAHITDASYGTVAADDVQRRLDTASALVLFAGHSSAESAVAAARAELGDQAVIAALPALQRFALSSGARAETRRHKGLLREVQRLVADVAPDMPTQDVRIERMRPRAILSLVAGTIAAYLITGQLAHVDLRALMDRAQPGWLAVALAGSVLTYIATTIVYLGVVTERLSFWRTLLAQTASSFANVMTPASVGAMALNTRFVTRAGVPAAMAVATVGLAQAAGAVTYITMLVAAVVTTGARQDLAFTLPRIAVVIAVVVLVAVAALLSVPALRTPLLDRVRPFLRQLAPRLVVFAQNPWRVAATIGGQALVNLSYVATLHACISALGGHLSLPATAVVYFSGAALGQAVPTPGGVGGVEAIMSAALAAAGLDVSTALSATLLFRLVTFWLPVIPGWAAFRYLTNRRYI